MPESALKYALELREERKSCFRYNGRGSEEATRKMLEKEQEYVEFSKELSTKEVVLRDLERIISETDNSYFGRDLKNQAHYVGFLSDDKELHKKLLPTAHSHWAMSQLDEKLQKHFLKKMAEMGFIARGSLLIEDNGYLEYFPELFRKMEEEEDKTERYDYLRIFAHYCTPSLRAIMIDALNSEKSDREKEWLTYKLLPAAIDEVWLYHQKIMHEGKDTDGGGEIARYGCPADLIHFKKGAEILWNDPDALEEMGDQLKFLGYAGDFSWYWHMLSHPSARVRRSFHWLMLSFFPEDDNSFEEGWELTGWPEEEPEATTEVLRNFWRKKADYVKHCLRPDVRYWNGRPFDIVEVFKSVYDDWDTSNWRTYADMLEMWTGRHFPLDNYALYEKQFRQYDAILAWLEEHRQEYKVGAWYRWGRQLPTS